MPPNLRSVFELAYEQGFDPDEIARIKNMEPEQVSNLLEKARKLLRVTLSERIFDT